jgi:hypothetical protein
LGAKDVGTRRVPEILQGSFAGAQRAAVDPPLLAPGCRCSLGKPRSLAPGIPKLGAKEAGKRLDMHEEMVLGPPPSLAIGGESAPRHEIRDMGMIVQVPCPRLEHTNHADLPTDQAWLFCPLLQGLGGGAKEQVVDQLLGTARSPAGKVKVTRK